MAFVEYENEIIANKVLDKVRKSKILFELINDRVKINFAMRRKNLSLKLFCQC